MVGIFGHTLQRFESTTRSRLPTQARTRQLLTLNYGKPTDGEGLKLKRKKAKKEREKMGGKKRTLRAEGGKEEKKKNHPATSSRVGRAGRKRKRKKI